MKLRSTRALDSQCAAVAARTGRITHSSLRHAALFVAVSATDGPRIDLRGREANPLRHDLFIEIDYMENFKPTDKAVAMLVEAFANSPVKNPEGPDGVTVHCKVDQLLAPEYSPVVLVNWSEFDHIKENNFDQNLRFAYHYVLFANMLRSETESYSGISDGIAARPNVIVSLGGWTYENEDEHTMQQAGTLMHELGHNLGLHHGGVFPGGRFGEDQFTPHYLSVMSYNYQTVGLQKNKGDYKIDYARYPIGAVSESALNEQDAYAPHGLTKEEDLAQYTDIRICASRSGGSCPTSARVSLNGNASSMLDFNRNGTFEGAVGAVDLNGDHRFGGFSPLLDDWSNLWFGLVPPGPRVNWALRTLDEIIEPCMPMPHDE